MLLLVSVDKEHSVDCYVKVDKNSAACYVNEEKDHKEHNVDWWVNVEKEHSFDCWVNVRKNTVLIAG